MITQKDLREMELHDVLVDEEKGFMVFCVPTGWLYSSADGSAPVYVPSYLDVYLNNPQFVT